MLMNTANTSIFINPATQPGVLAPITMIGAGEVRVDRALASTTAAWDEDTETPSLSFGYEAVTKATNLHRHVTIQNYSNNHRTYNITPQFRYANDQASGAVIIDSPGPVHVPPHGHHSFDLKLSIDPAKLPIWTLNGGSQGGNGSLLQTVEFDGYIEIADGVDSVRLPWHVLPHRAAGVGPAPNKKKLNLGKDGHGELELENKGTRDGRLDVFSLTGTSPKIPKRLLPGPGDAFAVVDLKAVGVRLVPLGSGVFALQFGITTHGERSHPNYPAEFDIYVDTDRDGDADYVIFNSENGGFAVTGQNVVSVVNLTVSPTPPPVTRFFADADLDSANMIYTVLLSDLGMTPNTQFDFAVLAGDNYFTGLITDAIGNMTYQPDTPRFVASVVPAGVVPAGGASMLVIDEIAGGAIASPSQSGLLLLYKDGAPGQEADTIVLK
jgi:hypothetical protein